MKTQVIFKSHNGQNAILNAYENLLKQWPVSHEKIFLTTRHGETFVIASGDPANPPLILLHGSSTNSAMWMGDVADFSRLFRVYAIDIPGEPGKSEPIRAVLNSPAPAEWISDVMDKLSISQASMIGISLGGWFALNFAATHPEQVTRLVLLCPAGVAPQKNSYFLRTLPLLLLGDWGIERGMRIASAGQPMPEEVVKFTGLIIKNFSPRMEMIPLLSDEALQQVTMPTFLIAGAKDALLPSEKTAERLSGVLPNFSACILADTGHIIIQQTERILRFLTQELETAR